VRALYFNPEDIDANCFVPVLRTSAAEARMKPAIVEVWNGELVFDRVCLDMPDSAGTSPEHTTTSGNAVRPEAP
jgi:hypothetical protein